MPKYKIENNSPFGKAFKVFGGTHEVRRGTTETIDVEHEFADEQIAAFARDDVTITPVKASASKSSKASASKDEKPEDKKDGEDE